MTTAFQNRWHDFWFRPVSAAGFGLMRIGFGCIALCTFLLEGPNISRYYGSAGILTKEMAGTMLRSEWRFSLLEVLPRGAELPLYWILLGALTLVAVGYKTRISLLVAVPLLFSFHEYGTVTLDGGDTLLRLIGFLLLLSPCDRALSLDTLFRRFRTAAASGKDQEASARTMPIWPYRLLLWQMIILYAASVIEKWQGSTWRAGTAVSIVLHNGNFSRLPTALADAVSGLSPIIGYFTLLTQAAWILLLPLGVLAILRQGITERGFNTFKRSLLLCGVLIHGGIFLLMDVGTFSLTVFVSYLGLLLDDDFRAIRKRFPSDKKAVILFDGRCGFCGKTVIVLRSLDWFHRLQFENLHDPSVRKTFAPDIPLKTLTEAMHVRMPDGTFFAGFTGFRALASLLPPLWPVFPVFFVPPVPLIGEKTYRFVAEHRA